MPRRTNTNKWKEPQRIRTGMDYIALSLMNDSQLREEKFRVQNDAYILNRALDKATSIRDKATSIREMERLVRKIKALHYKNDKIIERIERIERKSRTCNDRE